jgi:hypothetical protein
VSGIYKTSKYDIVSSELINLNQDELNVPLSPVGSLKARINEWKNIVVNDYIISIIENGYKLPLRKYVIAFLKY